MQVLEFTDLELKSEIQKVLKHGYTFYHEQNLTQSQLVNYCRRIGNTDDDVLGYMPFNPKDNPDISRVMYKGLFGMADLEWHGDGTMIHIGDFKEILTALYCVEECRDTVFSLLDQRRSFLDLPNNEKDYWRTVEIQLNNFNYGVFGSIDDAQKDRADREAIGNMMAHEVKYTMAGKDNEIAVVKDYTIPAHHKGDERMSIVNVHPIGGEEFLYWQPSLTERAWKNGKPTDVNIINDKLKKTLDRSIYQKHFVFKKGDLLIMDQLYTIHRRSHVVNKSRELWRVAFDYTTIIKE